MLLAGLLGRGQSIHPLAHMDGGRMYPKFSSISWTDSDGFFKYVDGGGRDFYPDRPPHGLIWTADGHIDLSHGRMWTTRRMDEARPLRPGY